LPNEPVPPVIKRILFIVKCSVFVICHFDKLSASQGKWCWVPSWMACWLHFCPLDPYFDWQTGLPRYRHYCNLLHDFAGQTDWALIS
jgi:hypothetical protein